MPKTNFKYRQHPTKAQEGVRVGEIAPLLPPEWRIHGNVQQMPDNVGLVVVSQRTIGPLASRGRIYSILAFKDGKLGLVFMDPEKEKQARFSTQEDAREYARVAALAAREAVR